MLLSESDTIGCGVFCLGGLPCSGFCDSMACASGVACGSMILCRQVRSASCNAFRCAAVVLDMRTCARFAVAAMMASAGVIVGLVMYLCLKNMVAEMRVERETGVHTIQQR